MQQNNRLLVIATSNSRKQYQQDFLNCMAYPAGAEYQFIYRSTWIQDSVRDLSLSQLKNTQALIVFCDPPIKKTKSSEFRFYPLRYVSLTKVYPDVLFHVKDETVYISLSFELQDFIELAQPNAAQKLEQWQLWMLSHENRPMVGDGNSTYVFWGHPAPFERSSLDDELSWVSIAEALSSTNSLRECMFYRLRRIVETSKKEPLKLAAISNHAGYRLRASRSYEIGFQYYQDPRSTSRPYQMLVPTVTTDSAYITPPLHQSRGTSTSALSVLNCNRIRATEVATVIVEDPDDRENQTARLEFLANIVPSIRFWRIFWLCILVGFGTFLAGLTTDSLPIIIIPTDWLPVIKDWMPIIKLIGAAAVTVGAFWGFSSAP